LLQATTDVEPHVVHTRCTFNSRPKPKLHASLLLDPIRAWHTPAMPAQCGETTHIPRGACPCTGQHNSRHYAGQPSACVGLQQAEEPACSYKAVSAVLQNPNTPAPTKESLRQHEQPCAKTHIIPADSALGFQVLKACDRNTQAKQELVQSFQTASTPQPWQLNCLKFRQVWGQVAHSLRPEQEVNPAIPDSK
jgi:hypothetical protein